MALYDTVDNLRARVFFKNNANPPQLTDPGTVTVTINGPGDNVNTYVYGTDVEVVRETTGTYHVDFTPTVYGRWWIDWFGSGALTAHTTLNFHVDQGD